MIDASRRMIFADQWHIEGNRAWFLSVERADLFEVNLKSQKVSFLAQVPGRESNAWRDYTHCFKFREAIYCFPDEGKFIWKYDMKTNAWKKICIETPQEVRLSIYRFWKIQDELLLFSPGLKSILHLSLEEDVISAYDSISFDEAETLGQAERVGDDILIVSSSAPNIYRYHIPSAQVEKKRLPGINEGLFTLSHDGTAFWMSGKKRMVYAWEIEKDAIEQHSLPDSFGVYNFDHPEWPLINTCVSDFEYPPFIGIICLHGSVWCIPAQTNEILYLEAGEKFFQSFPIKEEIENATSIRHRCLNHKYMVLYVREDRFIGLFSFRNECVIEIDTVNKVYEILEFDMNGVPFAVFGNKFRERFGRALSWMTYQLTNGGDFACRSANGEMKIDSGFIIYHQIV